MITAGMPREWQRFFGSSTTEDCASELMRLAHGLDGASDGLGAVLRALAGCPLADVEEALRVALRATDESFEMLRATAHRLRLLDPDAA